MLVPKKRKLTNHEIHEAIVEMSELSAYLKQGHSFEFYFQNWYRTIKSTFLFRKHKPFLNPLLGIEISKALDKKIVLLEKQICKTLTD